MAQLKRRSRACPRSAGLIRVRPAAEIGGGDAGPGHDRGQQAGAGELGHQPPRPRSIHRVAGLTARMMAECIPGAAWPVKVTDASVNPAAARPSRYSARDRAPAMQPT